MSRITVKLTLYFTLILFSFAALIGGVFIYSFQKNTTEIYKVDMQKRAEVISDDLGGYLGTDRVYAPQSGFGMYINLVDEIAGTDVWILNSEGEFLSNDRPRPLHNELEDAKPFDNKELNPFDNSAEGYKELPDEAESIIDEVLEGKTTFSEKFNDYLITPSITVGVPVTSEDGVVVGAVLLHSPISGTDEPFNEAVSILIISTIVAFIISFIIAIVLSKSFTKPLKKMNGTANMLAQGDYLVRNNINLKDEIGQLAVTMDCLAETLEQSKIESDKLDSLRKEFLANVSHELRTPVTVMKGSLEALVDKIITEEDMIDSYHKEMLKEAEFLQRLLGDLLDLAKLDSLDFSLEKEEIYIPQLINDLARSSQIIANKREVKVKVIIDQAAEAEVDVKTPYIGDYDRIRQMLFIVLDNGIRASKEGASIEIRYECNKISIIDEGVGISKEFLTHIFDRFYKSNDESNKTGSGLGLQIAKQIADRSGIAISVESKEGEGTRFDFFL